MKAVVNLPKNSHIRVNILTGEKILVSPHRTQRPWQGKKEEVPKKKEIQYDPNCYLCPGNNRFGGEINPLYKGTFVFKNDYSALIPEIEEVKLQEGLFSAHSEKGICKVVCFSPDHSQTLSQMDLQQIGRVIETWQEEFSQLSSYEYINNVQIFENKGAIMGCSNPHPHGQIWAQQSIPLQIQLKTQRFAMHKTTNARSLLEDYIEQELKINQRIITENEHFVVLVPFWAVWPYETMIVSKRAMKHITEMTGNERNCFAQSIGDITKIYDRVFEVSFPYSSGIHQAPVDGKENVGWHWHMTFFPPLLRSATVKKFMVGYEMFGMSQRDITPEQAAETLKGLK